MVEMRTDVSGLRKGAADFDNNARNLKTEIDIVDATANDVQVHWQGAAGGAFQEATVRYRDAATAVKARLDEISEKVHGAAGQFEQQDESQQQDLSRAMNFG